MTPMDPEREQVEKILRNPLFSNSPRLSRFLRFVVDETLAGRADRIKESVIGVEVFDKNPTYDPRADATVRTEASKLRSKLNAYYETSGKSDLLVISVPKGGYVPVFTSRPATGVVPPPAGGMRVADRSIASHLHWIAAAALLLLVAGGSWMILAWGPLGSPSSASQNLEALRLASRGYTFMRAGTPQDLRNAIDYFNLAIAADPRNARAFANLSLTYSKLLESETAPSGELIALAKSRAQEAWGLDRSIAETHHALAQSLILSGHSWDAADSQFRQALAIDPAYTEARYAYAHMCLTPRGLFDEAARQLNEGLKHDSLSGMLNAELASTDIKRGRIDQAIDRLRETLTRYPSSPGALTNLAVALSAKSQYHEALPNLLLARVRAPGDPWIASHLALCYVQLGERARALAILQELQAFTPPPDTSIAAVYAALGENDAAFEHLGRAYSAHSMKLLWLDVDRRYWPLRGDLRFRDLLARLQLP